MKISFVLGSGISRPAGFPSLDEITRQVLSPKEFFRHSDGVYRRSVPGQLSPELLRMQMPEMEQIEQLLRWLKGYAEVRYAADKGRWVNYEDLAYLVTQIHEDAIGEYENPALIPLVCCAVNALPGMCSSGDFDQWVERVVNYIHDVVAGLLSVQSPCWDYLNIFRRAVSDNRFREVSFFTLNHDCLLEGYLKANGLVVVDGFDEENHLGVRHWNPKLFDCGRINAALPAVRLYKLHGSIDWRRFRPRVKANNAISSNPWCEEYVGVRSSSALACGRDEQGRVHEELGRALFLAGTFNKMFSYLNDVFLELHYRFHRTLLEAEGLVVCGYGFGDKGINNRIVDWMCFSNPQNKRKVVLVEPRSFEQLELSSRGAIAGKLAEWKEEGRLVYLQHSIESLEMTWERVSEELLKK